MPTENVEVLTTEAGSGWDAISRIEAVRRDIESGLPEERQITTTEQILELLVRLNVELNTTLVMVTHDSDAAAVAQRQLRLEKGALVEAGPAVPEHAGGGR